MERNTADILCFLIVCLVGIVFVFDLLAAAWAAAKKQPYKSMIGNFVERFTDEPKLAWLPVLIALLYAYGFYTSVNF